MKATPYVVERTGDNPVCADPYIIGHHASLAIEIAKNMALSNHASPERIAEDAVQVTELLMNKMLERGWVVEIKDPFTIA